MDRIQTNKMARDRFLVEIEGILLLGFVAFLATIVLFLYGLPEGLVSVVLKMGAFNTAVSFVAVWAIVFAFFVAIVSAYYFLHPHYSVELRRKVPRNARKKRRR